MHAKANPTSRYRGASALVIWISAGLIGIWVASCALHLWYGDGESWTVTYGGGGVGVSWGERPSWPYKYVHAYGFVWKFRPRDGVLLLPVQETIDNFHFVGAPLWPLALIAACLIFREMIRFRRRRPKGCCRSCGYDLRGLSEYRCPECGTPFESSEDESEARHL